MENPSISLAEGRALREAVVLTFSPEQRKKYEDRFWSRVNRKSQKECWEWTEFTYDSGNSYGGFKIFPYATLRAHRLAWTFYYSSAIPAKLFVCHRCDNKICCNPNHLFLGTQTTNNYDSFLKNRTTKNRLLESKIPIKKKKDIIVAMLDPEARICNMSIIFSETQAAIGTTMKRFFLRDTDRSWLPEELKKKYAHCKSWKEVKELREKYGLEDASGKNQSTQPL